MLLLLNVLRNRRERRSPYRRERRSPYRTHEVTIGPQRRELALQDWKLLTEEPRGATLHESYQSMDSELWITFNEQMDMIGHDLYA